MAKVKVTYQVTYVFETTDEDLPLADIEDAASDIKNYLEYQVPDQLTNEINDVTDCRCESITDADVDVDREEPDADDYTDDEEDFDA